VIGGDGNDALLGGAGKDKIVGGKGDDVLAGFLGRDVLFGGTGEDEFRFLSAVDSVVGGNRDVIRDFVHGIDRINLKRIDGDTSREGNQRLEYIGNDQFSGTAGEFRTTRSMLVADLDGDGAADFQIKVDGLGSANQHDFIV
jgi:Ca2+-binding RTX toxin-like protein